MSESLRNDGRIWVPKNRGDKRSPNEIPEDQRDYYLERKYPSFGNLAPRDISSRSAKEVCEDGKGISATGFGVYLDFKDAIERLGKNTIKERYGNLFEMYERIAATDPYKEPMQIYPASHYTMGGLWVDYNLQSTIPGLHVIGEANFSDHGANRLGASALMQGLADGYFVIPYTIANYMATNDMTRVDTGHPEFKKAEEDSKNRINRLLCVKGKQTATQLHRKLGRIMWEYVGMGRNREGLKKALEEIPKLREEFWQDVNVSGSDRDMNTALEKANRVADFIEFAEIMAWDALEREESCGAHFREEYQYEDGEAKRDDENFTHVAAWEFTGSGNKPKRHTEELAFENVQLAVRSYK